MPNDEKLLTIEEQDACQKIAASGGLASQRAAALLALDQGATRAQASEQTGLTLGQIGYLLRAFEQKRLDLFPDADPPKEEMEQPSTEPAEAKGDKKEKAKAKKPKKDKKDKAKAKKKDKEPKKEKAMKKDKESKKEKPKAKVKAKKAKKDKESKKDKTAKKKSKKK